MSKKKRSSDEEIWSKRFDEEYEDLEYVSRSERTKNEKQNNDEGMSPMLTGTVMFLAVLILATIFYYVWYSNRVEDPVVTSEEPKTEEVEEETDQSKKDSDKVKKESESKPEPEPEPEPEPVAPAPEPEPAPEASLPIGFITSRHRYIPSETFGCSGKP